MLLYQGRHTNDYLEVENSGHYLSAHGMDVINNKGFEPFREQ